MKNVYMDHAAGMPIDRRVFETMKKYFLENYGNPFSVHSSGSKSRGAIREAREKVAQLIGAEQAEEVIFSGVLTFQDLSECRTGCFWNVNKSKYSHSSVPFRVQDFRIFWCKIVLHTLLVIYVFR